MQTNFPFSNLVQTNQDSQELFMYKFFWIIKIGQQSQNI